MGGVVAEFWKKVSKKRPAATAPWFLTVTVTLGLTETRAYWIGSYALHD